MEVVQSPSVLFGPPFHSWFVPTLCRNLNPPSGKFSYAMWGLVFSIVPSVSAHIAPIACPPFRTREEKRGRRVLQSKQRGHIVVATTPLNDLVVVPVRTATPTSTSTLGCGATSPHTNRIPALILNPLLFPSSPARIPAQFIFSPTPRLQSTPPSLARPTVHVASPPLFSPRRNRRTKQATLRPSTPK